MPFDGVAVRCIAHELDKLLKGGRVDKISMPGAEDVVMHVRSQGTNYKILLSCNPSFPRCYLTDVSRENPTVPPNFCMLLRKYLSGGKILSVTQPAMERILEFAVESHSELGDTVTKRLILELMGRHSNLILVHETGKIADCVRRIDGSISSVRLVLPGLSYESPPPQEKKDPLLCGFQDIFSCFQHAPEGKTADRVLLEAFSGLSPLICREIVFRALGTAQKLVGEMSEDEKREVTSHAQRFFEQIAKNKFEPILLFGAEDGKPMDFYPFSIQQYESFARAQRVERLCSSMDHFFHEKERHQRMQQRGGDLIRTVENLLSRYRKKAQLQKQSIQQAEEKDQFKLWGDLIMANMYMIQKGDRVANVINYFDEKQATIEIPLDASLSPAENAQKYYARYNKLKNTEAAAAQQLQHSLEDITYLESVQTTLDQCESLKELQEIKNELAEGGYVSLKQGKGKKKSPSALSAPAKYLSSDGFEIYVGKNNKQNDYLTLKMAKGHDIWFHTKTIPGSHTVIFTEKKEVPPRTMEEAAMLAAYHSKAREGVNVPVDYTMVKNVKKPSGAKPGMVIYVNYETIFITPKKELVEQLEKL